MNVQWNGLSHVISENPNDETCVIIGVISIRFYIEGQWEARRVKDPFKPHMDYTMGDMEALLEELQSIPK